MAASGAHPNRLFFGRHDRARLRLGLCHPRRTHWGVTGCLHRRTGELGHWGPKLGESSVRTGLRAVTVANLTDIAAQRHRRGMNELLVGHSYQQSDKISPPSTTGCARSASAMIAYAFDNG
jgi:hypothetical protein